MNEHLTNNFEQYRNKVIETNQEMYSITQLMDKETAYQFFSEESRVQIMKEFLLAQDKMNNLYRESVSY